jgi:hypothetical protein
MQQPARYCLFALLVFACLLFAGTVLEILLLLCVVRGVSAFSGMLKAKPVPVAEVEAELSRLARISRLDGPPHLVLESHNGRCYGARHAFRGIR